jgi:ABC-type transport system involved in multi-copper enzyme maturation permease subunit
LSRSTFLLSKFCSLALFLFFSTLILGACCAVVILLASATYPSEVPIHWGNISLALCGTMAKYLLLGALALLLSSLSTSFYLPFFGTLAIYLCGSASQEVYEYVTGEFGKGIDPVATTLVKAAYYLLPNFSAFDFQVQAVYALAVPTEGLLLTASYAAVYICILLVLAVLSFEKRELQ